MKPIPNTLTQWIRTFSKNLENWMTLALQNVPEELKAIKVYLIVLDTIYQIFLKKVPKFDFSFSMLKSSESVSCFFSLKNTNLGTNFLLLTFDKTNF